MPTLAEIYAQQNAGVQSANLKRGTTQRSLGGTQVVRTQAVRAPQQAIIPAFISKARAVGGQTFDITRTLGDATRRFVGNSAVDIGRAAWGTVNAVPNVTRSMIKQREVANNNALLDAKQKQIVTAYKMGRMSKENYSKSLRALSEGYQITSKESIEAQRLADPKQAISDIGWTAINVALAGGATLVRQGVKQGGKQIAKNRLAASTEKAVAKMTDVVVKVPAAGAVLERNAAKVVAREAQKMAGESTEQWLARSGKDAAIGLLIKRPLFYQQNIGFANEAYKHILDGEYDNALTPMAWLGVQMIGGGPLIAGSKYIKGKAGELAKGRGSFIDELSKQTDTNLADYITKNADSARTWKIAQHTNMTAAGGKADDAAQNFLQPYIQAGVDLPSLTEKELTEGMARWASADELRVKYLGMGIIKGVDPADIDKYAVVRWDTVMKDGLTRELTQSVPQGRLDLNSRQGMLEKLIDISERPGVGWGNNELLLTRIQNIVANADTVEDVAKGIKQIDTASVALKGMPKKIAKEFADLGYTLAAPFGGNKIARVDYENIDAQKIITGAMNNNPELFNPAVAPQPILSAISGALRKTGLTPEGNAQIANRRLSESLIADLGQLDVARPLGLEGTGDAVNGGKAILSQLQRYVETKKGAFILNKISSGKSAVTDIRQLTNDEIATALNIGKADAAKVSKAIQHAYLRVPLELRGLGDKIVDYAITAPGSPMRYYMRIQSALRYTYNPFFRFQEQVETAVLTQMDANKFIWPSRTLDDTARKLESSGLFSGNVFGAGADDAVIGRISANLTKYQKRNLAGLAEAIAKTQGKTVADVLRDNPEQIDDALRMIVQYPKKGVLASPLARTLNIAFFPIRYNSKVTVVAAEKLATMPTSIQFATIQGLFKMKEWLKSDEGLAWQAEHADAIAVWSWATPVGSIASFYRILAGNVSAPGEMGLLGGLPFGVITQILDGQGIINLNKPYVDPKTGSVIPDYIPLTTQAKAATALQDLLGSMFSFPGRTLGLPGKEANLRKVVDAFIDTEGKDFEKRINMDELTPLQKNMVRVLKGDTSEETLNSLYYSPADGQFDYYTLPPMDLPKTRVLAPYAAPDVTRRAGLPTKKQLSDAKKAAKKSGRDEQGNKIKPLPAPITR